MSEIHARSRGYSADKGSLIKRLHRIQGQVRGIERMVEEERYCVDVITQVSAVCAALESLALEILGEHVKSCVAGAFAAGDQRTAELRSRDLLEAVERFAPMR